MKLASYLIVENNPRQGPSSWSIHLEMANTGILDPLVHLFFARTRDMANLVLINEIDRLHGLAQRVASLFPYLLKKVSAPLPNIPSHDK